MIDRQVRFPGKGRELDGYLALPGGAGRRPAVVVIQEIWGLDEHIREVARRLAGEGYVALAPDLYTGELRQVMARDRIVAAMTFLRQAPPEIQRDPSRIEALIAERPAEEQPGLRALLRVMGPAQREAFALDLVAALAFLGSLPEVDSGRLASLGFCLGGGLSARLATLAPELACCVIFYGENPPLEEVPRIQAAVLGLYGGEDSRITDRVPEFVEAMRRAGKSLEHHVYAGAAHAFFNDTRPSHHPEAAADAWRRVLDFLSRCGTGGNGG